MDCVLQVAIIGELVEGYVVSLDAKRTFSGGKSAAVIMD
jgi:hypothetical protein